MQGRTGREFPFYKVRDVSAAWNAGSMMLLETENSLSAEEAASIRAKPIPAGSIVFAKIGEALRLNRRAITNTPCLIDNNMMGIWASSDFLDSQYLFWFSTITRFDTDARASVVPSIRKSDISELQFSLPPRTEQARIVEKLESLLADLDAGVAELKAAQRKLAQYRQSLLKAAVPPTRRRKLARNCSPASCANAAPASSKSTAPRKNTRNPPPRIPRNCPRCRRGGFGRRLTNARLMKTALLMDRSDPT
jgi:type I restriction enzyme S subunit